VQKTSRALSAFPGIFGSRPAAMNEKPQSLEFLGTVCYHPFCLVNRVFMDGRQPSYEFNRGTGLASFS
jgi:hypothetical protein